MFSQKLLDEFSKKISEAISAIPIKDVEKNIHAVMMSFFSHLDLVTREEFDVQAELLAKTSEQLNQALSRIDALEKQTTENIETKSE